MAEFIGRDAESARALLAGAGVRILRLDDPQREDELTRVLGDLTQERAVITAEPPQDAAAAAEGMGAWHINGANEFETVIDGEGIVEFMTADGAVAVHMGPGDIMAVERAEHRYRPLTTQQWVLRFAADDLAAVDTGRVSGPWPIP